MVLLSFLRRLARRVPLVCAQKPGGTSLSPLREAMWLPYRSECFSACGVSLKPHFQEGLFRPLPPRLKPPEAVPPPPTPCRQGGSLRLQTQCAWDDRPMKTALSSVKMYA